MDSAVFSDDSVYSFRNSISGHICDGNLQLFDEDNILFESSVPCEEDQIGRYYAVFAGTNFDRDRRKTIIFTDKNSALTEMRTYKKARLKEFSRREDAVNFALYGGEEPPVPTSIQWRDQPSWRTPKSKELVSFRKAIQCCDLAEVVEAVEENPRFLVGCGDTPTILQEGCRYNALHIAAIARSSRLCSYILSVVTDMQYIERLYGTTHSNEERIDILLDLYLNTPDKGSHETPLHHASKNGALDVVNVLLRYRQCDKSKKNKDGLTALDIACQRAPKYLISNKNKIIESLTVHFFIPLMRSNDNEVFPCVGEPCSPENPPESKSDGVTSPLVVRALAGPMSKVAAQEFRKKWKTPPRNLKGLSDRPQVSDPNKGFEKVGRKLASEFGVGWKEYWSFLDSFVNLSSSDGLYALENHLRKVYGRKRYCIARKVTDVYSSGLSTDPDLNGTGPCISPQRNGIETMEHKGVLYPMDDPTCSHLSYAIQNKSLIESLDDEIDVDSLSCYTYTTNPDRNYNFSNVGINQFYEYFADQIVNASLLGTKSLVLTEVNNFQMFIGECARHGRFLGLDAELTKSHYEMAMLIRKRIFEVFNSHKATIDFLRFTLAIDIEDFEVSSRVLSFVHLVEATACMLKYIAAISPLLEDSKVDSCETKLDNHFPHNKKKCCLCKIPYAPYGLVSIPVLCRRLYFNNDENSLSSDDTFYTARNSSHGETKPENCASQGADCDLTTELFLTGSELSAVDRAALDVIESLTLSPSEYPYTTIWKQSCLRRLRGERPPDTLPLLKSNPEHELFSQD